MYPEEEEDQEYCFVVDIIVCIFIVGIAIITFGVGLVLFLFYIPFSLLVHYLIHQDAKKKRLVSEYGRIQELELKSSENEFLRNRQTTTTTESKEKEVW